MITKQDLDMLSVPEDDVEASVLFEYIGDVLDRCVSIGKGERLRILSSEYVQKMRKE
jgi:hypothetical protein